MVATVRDPEEVFALARANPSIWASLAGGIIQGPFHDRFQRHLTSHNDALIGLARGHGKTTQLCLRVSHEIGNDPNIRVKLTQQTDEEARKSSKLIRTIVKSEIFRQVFPGVEIESGDDTAGAWTVTRQRVGRDPTLEARGIFGRAGGRWDLLICDDICDLRNAVQQPALRLQVKEFYENNWLPMGDPTGDTEPRIWKVGTPYHVADIMADWKRQHSEDGSLLWLPVTNFRSPWPEGFTEERMRAVREKMGPVAYSRAYELVPVSSEILIFDGAWIDLYEEIPETELRRDGQMVATFDFAYTEEKLKDDPDYSVCLIGWQTYSGNLWLTSLYRARLPFPEFKRHALALCARAGVTQARAEANGPQKGIVQQLNHEAPFPVIGLERSKDKITRAAERQAFVESGRLHMPARRGPTGEKVPAKEFQILYDEMTTFPASEHDDTVDAVVDMMGMTTRTPGRINVTRIPSPKSRPGSIYG